MPEKANIETEADVPGKIMLETQPDVVFIGYQRAGSTFLRSYFTHHPGIEWTRVSDYFGIDNNYHSPGVHYFDRRAAPPQDKARCVIDMYEGNAVGYIAGPEFPQLEDKIHYVKRDIRTRFQKKYYYPGMAEVANRIKAEAPDAKIAIIIRNQVDWLRSNYLHNILDLPKGNKTFFDFIATRAGKCVLAAALYNQTIEAYYQRFGRENVHVMLLEQVKKDLDGTLESLCRFLGVDFVSFPKSAHKKNIGFGKRTGRGIQKLSRLGFGLTRDNIDKHKRLIWLMEKMKFLDSDLFGAEERAFINAFYAAGNFYTSELLGIDLAEYGYPI